VPLPEGACLDSMNVLPALMGETGAKGRDHLLQQDNGVSGNFGLRMGDWKLVRQKTKGKTQAVVSMKARAEGQKNHSLYFLPDDPAEVKDVSSKHPEKTQQFIERMDTILQSTRTR